MQKENLFHDTTPTLFPSSPSFKSELLCKEEFKDNSESIALKEKAELIVDDTKTLRKTIISVQKIEEDGTKALFRVNFIQCLLDIFEICSLYTRTVFKEVLSPFDIKDSSELLLQQFSTSTAI